MAYTDYAPYFIFFHDRNEYEFAIVALGGTAETGAEFDGSPVHAAEFFGIPIPFPSGNMDLIDKGIYYNTQYFPTKELNIFAPPNVIMNDTTDEYVVPGYPGSAGFAASGVSRTVRWRGIVLYMQGAEQSGATPTAIPQRRWACGNELPNGEGGSFSLCATRDASRSLDGLGIPIRGNSMAVDWTRLPTEYGAAASVKSWERLYFRPRVPGATIVAFWRCRGTSSPAAGAILVYTPTGAIALYTVSNVGGLTLIATSAVLTGFTWVKLDMLLKFPTIGTDDGTLQVYINGVLTFNLVDGTGNGMDTTGFHSQSNIGKGCSLGIAGLADAVVEYDLDDWINSAWPDNLGVLVLDSPDWIMGSHIRRAWNTSATAASYTPAAPLLINQGMNPDNVISAQLASSTANALIEGLSELPALGIQDKDGEVALGVVAATICVNSAVAGVLDGNLGYNAAGAGAVMAPILETGVNAPLTAMFRPSGLLIPAEVTPFLVRYTKSNNVSACNVRALDAVLEYIGVWGTEDVLDPELFPDDRPRLGHQHNCRYPNTPFGFMGPTLDCPVYVKGGTYVGNGTYQEVALPSAAHMIFIRALTVGALGVKWFATGLGGHNGTTETFRPQHIERCWYDAVAGSFKFSVVGDDAESNNLGVTYQYIAFCDPGMRFSVMGCYNTPSNVTSRARALQNTNFTPEFAFIQHEVFTNSASQGLFVKGPGNTGSNGNQLNNAGAVATLCTFANGVLTTETNAHDTSPAQVNYAVFRSTEPGCGWTMLQILSYTGNGVSPRNIPLTPVSGRFPLFVLVCPTSGAQAAIFRDPSHAGANSAAFATLANTVLGITAGAIDQITVQSQLNALGVVYNVFCIPGTSAGWINGTFFPPNCDSPEAFYNPPVDVPEIVVAAEGGLVLGGTVPLTMLRDISGIYTLVQGKTNDTLIDRQTGVDSVDVKIPDPFFKTGYIGG